MYIKNSSWLSGFLMQAARYFYQIPYLYQKHFHNGRKFSFQEHQYDYFVHPYNATWRNERAIEVPIARHLIKQNDPQAILEVGNVISHYYPSSHLVVDKFERDRNIVKKDIIEFNISRKFDLILCISTIEHIGWDENPRVLGKHRKVLAHLRTMLSTGGKMLVTMPIGYNSDLDDDIGQAFLGFDECLFLKRVSMDKWINCSWSDVENAQYNMPYPRANALAICLNC